MGAPWSDSPDDLAVQPGPTVLETTMVGAIPLAPLLDVAVRYDPTASYPRAASNAGRRGFDTEDWGPHTDILEHDGTLDHPYGAFLVRHGEHVVLVDAGLGPEPIGPFGPAY